MFRLPTAGEQFGRYRLLRKLGQGGMGVVYAAHDPSLDREVALKLVVPHLAGDDEFRARFQHEAAVLAKLESPRIVRIYDHGEHDGTLFLVTQLVAGGDLHKLVANDGPLSPALATDVLRQVLEGLADAHAVGVTHRDIKPANVLLRDRGRELEAFLCDFGIATTPGAHRSRTGTVAGSLPYMAPERHRGEQAGPQGDVYAAGCLLWHALTGSAPYAGTDVEVALAHIQAPLPQLPGKDPFSLRANEVIAKAMAKDQRKRYPTALAMLADLRSLAALAPDAISLPGATAIRHALPLPRRRRRAGLVAALAVLAVLGTTAAGWSVLRGGEPGNAEPSSGPVTETVSLSAAPVVDAQHTLYPRPLVTRRGGRLVTVPASPLVPAGGGGTTPPGVTSPTPPQSRPSTRPSRDGQQTPPPTTSAPPPQPAYRCWDGRELVSSTSCDTVPTGVRGAAWMFPDLPNLGCVNYDIPDVSGDVESWICDYAGPKSGSSWITFARWTSVQAAKDYYYRWFNHDETFHNTTWMLGSTAAGKHYYGRKGDVAGHKRWRDARIYAVGPWSIAINASELDNRNRGYQLANDFRAPSQYRYQPL